ncbi:hypothetical protein BBW68_02310 [Candidatus Erwinia dacicola]|uniref:Uncharacterized protein n=1 Tax=Candidatus Erwinia dacicola TaxID=252393 RepID=A0A1E7YV68_9GAMM|nr:hypothetical protein BBW68_02310 [Candidatus Erwinia dacicola]RAP72189.1 hypothetical protein ACZ87_00984 [Candidatus Erwinia dacicola]
MSGKPKDNYKYSERAACSIIPLPQLMQKSPLGAQQLRQAEILIVIACSHRGDLCQLGIVTVVPVGKQVMY